MGIRFGNSARRSVGALMVARMGVVARPAASVLGRKILQVNRVAIAILGCCSLVATGAAAGPMVFDDSYVLQTSNQGMFAPGGQSQSSWTYESGLLGASWGIYAGPKPESVPCCDDHLSLSSSGRIGIDVSAQANGGAIDVTLPVTTKLTIGDPVNGTMHVGGSSTFGKNSAFDKDPVITARAPSFKASLDGVFNLAVDITASAFGESRTVSLLPLPLQLFSDAGQFPLVGVDTSNKKPVSVFGYDLGVLSFGKEYQFRAGQPPCQGPKEADGTAPICSSDPISLARPVLYVLKPSKLEDFTDGTKNVIGPPSETVLTEIKDKEGVPKGVVLSISHNQDLLRGTLDVTGIAQYLLGFPIDVLNPKLKLVVDVPLIPTFTLFSISGSVFDLQAGLAIGETQSFSFTPELQVKLELDKPVTEWAYQSRIVTECAFVIFCTSKKVTELVKVATDTTVVTVDLGVGADLIFTGDAPNVLRRTYSIIDGQNFESDTSLSLDAVLAVQAGCISGSLAIYGSIGSVCAFPEEEFSTNLKNWNVKSTSFALGGFNTATFGDVPAPSTLWLLGLGLAGLAIRRTLAVWRRHG